MTPHLVQVSVIIPVAPGDRAWIHLIKDLEELPLDTEITFVSPQLSPEAPRELRRLSVSRTVRWLEAPAGIPEQLNMGAKRTDRQFLWILPADTRVASAAIDALEASLSAQPEAIHAFDLVYGDEEYSTPPGLLLQSGYYWARLHLLKSPGLNQCLCFPRSLWEKEDGFEPGAGREAIPRWIRKARRHGARIVSVGENVTTSSRKYLEQGWARATLDDISGLFK
jgi:hypothetical protein